MKTPTFIVSVIIPALAGFASMQCLHLRDANNRLRKELAEARQDAAASQLAAEQLWQTINRAADAR